LKNTRLRNALALGTSFSALFLLVNCEVPQRDYSVLNIGGTTSSGPDDFLQADAGSSDAGVSGPVGPVPLPPVPCSEDAGVSNTNVHDAGSADAGSADASTADASASASSAAGNGSRSLCECVEGFYKAVDADGDGEGTSACSIAPGLDCDDADPAITHNGCGGCTALPAELGADCQDCGTYVCDGTDALACASKPGPVEDPDCRCQDGLLVARDTDQDGQGTRLCEANPGIDCNDGDETFLANECGGCEPLPGVVGGACNECGVYTCNGAAMVCAPPTGAGSQHCLNTTTRQTCVGTGFWSNDFACPNVCYQGNCETCTPGTFRCQGPYSGSYLLQVCITDASIGSSSYGIGWGSYLSCTAAQGCNATTGACTGYLLLPRDDDFEVAPSLRGGLPWHELLNTASDSDYG
jgi:hypothetical protein